MENEITYRSAKKWFREFDFTGTVDKIFERQIKVRRGKSQASIPIWTNGLIFADIAEGDPVKVTVKISCFESRKDNEYACSLNLIDIVKLEDPSAVDEIPATWRMCVVVEESFFLQEDRGSCTRVGDQMIKATRLESDYEMEMEPYYFRYYDAESDGTKPLETGPYKVTFDLILSDRATFWNEGDKGTTRYRGIFNKEEGTWRPIFRPFLKATRFESDY